MRNQGMGGTKVQQVLPLFNSEKLLSADFVLLGTVSIN